MPVRDDVFVTPGRPWLVGAACAAGVAAAWFVDYVTGYEVRTYPFYFLPIALAAWRLPRALAVVFAVLSTGAWLAANALAGGSYSSVSIWVFNSATQLLSFSLVGLLIAELRRRLLVERSLSREDPLTSLPNVRAFHEQAELLFAVARRSGAPVTVAYIDLDGFKGINDRLGHQQGDRVLSAAAALLRRHTRASDVVARLGGDEFGIILPDTDPEAARRSLERLRDMIATSMRQHDWPITTSVGAVAFVQPPGSVADAVRRADTLMYRAKRAGKNQVHLEMVPSSRARSEQQRPDRAPGSG
jgi:diguanylate cyclase (GGDEF)-like protein